MAQTAIFNCCCFSFLHFFFQFISEYFVLFLFLFLFYFPYFGWVFQLLYVFRSCQQFQFTMQHGQDFDSESICLSVCLAVCLLFGRGSCSQLPLRESLREIHKWFISCSLFEVRNDTDYNIC